MSELINWTRSPLVVTGGDGKKVTIEPGKSKPVSGDFSHHPWVKKGLIEIAGMKSTDSDDGDDHDLERLRMQYQNIFGKPAHKNAGAETIRNKIDEWKNQSE
jgi:hypothetical protein